MGKDTNKIEIPESLKNIDFSKLCPEIMQFIDQIDTDTILSKSKGLGIQDLSEWKSPVMKSYWKRANSNDPKCKRVSMREGDMINFSDNPEEDEVIFTFGLCGCIATTLALEMKDGSQKAILTHYDPLAIIEGGQKIRDLGSNIDTNEVKDAHLFIMAPSEWKTDSSGKFIEEVKESYEQYMGLLEVSGKIVGGAETKVSIIPYSEEKNIGAQNEGTFRIVKGKDKTLKYISENYAKYGDVF